MAISKSPQHVSVCNASDRAMLRELLKHEKPGLVVPEIEAFATPMREVLEVLDATGVVRVTPPRARHA